MMFDYQPCLTGHLVTLRPLVADDWQGLFEVGGDPRVWELHPRRDRYTQTNFRAYFDEGLASGGALVALNGTTGAIAGWSRYSAHYADAGEIEIGWTFLGRAYWGGGWNAEMKRLMLDHAFQTVDRVIFRIDENNGRSRRAAEKIGAKLTARSQPTIIAGTPFRNLFYSIERSEFCTV